MQISPRFVNNYHCSVKQWHTLKYFKINSMLPSTWTVDFFIWSIVKGLQIKLPLAFIAFGANFVVRSSICYIFFSYIDYFATSMTIFQVWIIQMFTRMKFLISQNSHSWSVPEKRGRNISNFSQKYSKVNQSKTRFP